MIRIAALFAFAWALLAPAAAFGEQTAAQREWYYAEGTAVAGPYDLNSMQQYIAGGQVKAETQAYVARNGWRLAKDHPELAGFFTPATDPAAGGAPPPPPPPPATTEPAAPPPPTASDIQAKVTSYFAGTWRTEFSTTMYDGKPANVIAEVSYMNGGVAKGIYQFFDMAGQSIMTMTAGGSYTLQPTDEKHFILTAQFQWNGQGGTDRLIYSLEIIDEATMIDTQNKIYWKRIR